MHGGRYRSAGRAEVDQYGGATHGKNEIKVQERESESTKGREIESGPTAAADHSENPIARALCVPSLARRAPS